MKWQELSGEERYRVVELARKGEVPIRELCGFRRIHLAPSEAQTVTFALTPRQMSIIDEDGQRVIEPGTFWICAGGRQPVPEDTGADGSDLVLGTLEVTGATATVGD